MTLWLDVADIFDYAVYLRAAGVPARPSGIQRLAYELYVALRAESAEGAVRLVRHDSGAGCFRVIEWSEFEAFYGGMVGSPSGTAPRLGTEARRDLPPADSRLRRLARRLPPELRSPLNEALRAQTQALRAAWRFARRLPAAASGRHRIAASGPELGSLAQRGDVLASFGSSFSQPGYDASVAAVTSRAGLRFALLLYDLIPLRRPEFCDAALVDDFRRFAEGCVPLADVLLTISEATAEDTRRWASEAGVRLRASPRAIPIGTGFTETEPVGTLPAGLAAGGYVLFVSTIEARKNHLLAFRAWRRLLAERPAGEVPVLVFAGRIGWMVGDLLQQIENAAGLGGKLLIIQNPDDSTLSALYRGARFTIFPSLYEGWGLPVSESLAFGKVCIASSSSSIPEAGGAFCPYHDPDDIREASALYRRAIENPGWIAGLEARIATEYRPTPWSATARAVLDALG